MRKNKADQTVERMCIILSLIQKDTAFLHQGVNELWLSETDVGQIRCSENQRVFF